MHNQEENSKAAGLFTFIHPLKHSYNYILSFNEITRLRSFPQATGDSRGKGLTVRTALW